MHNLLNQINSLSAAEKAELLDALWKSLETDAASLPDAQRAELDHRIAQHEQSLADVIPGEQVRTGPFKNPCRSRTLFGSGFLFAASWSLISGYR